jgi:putative transposase
MKMGDTSKRYKPEQIVSMLREAEVELSKGQSIAAVAKKLGITDQTYYRWRLPPVSTAG